MMSKYDVAKFWDAVDEMSYSEMKEVAGLICLAGLDSDEVHSPNIIEMSDALVEARRVRQAEIKVEEKAEQKAKAASEQPNDPS